MFAIRTKFYKKLEYLVTGTGRCGTVFFSHLLTNMGIPCGHEHIFNFQSKRICFGRLIYPERRLNSNVSEHDFLNPNYENKYVDPKKTIAESSYFLVPYLNEHYLSGIPLLHLVRNPFKVIRSFVDDFNYFKDGNRIEDKNIDLYENFIYTTYPEIKNYTNPYDRAAQYYISCNKKIFEQKTKRPYLLIKIEEFKIKKTIIQKFFKKIFPEKMPNHLNSRTKEKTQDIDFSFFESNNIKNDLKSIMDHLAY